MPKEEPKPPSQGSGSPSADHRFNNNQSTNKAGGQSSDSDRQQAVAQDIGKFFGNNKKFKTIDLGPATQRLLEICYLCNGRHWVIECPTYKTAEQRKKSAIQKGLCIRCFSSRHCTSDCQRTNKCRCGGLNHPAFCERAIAIKVIWRPR